MRATQTNTKRQGEPSLRFSLRSLLLAPLALALLIALGRSFGGGWVLAAFIGLTLAIVIAFDCLAFAFGRTPRVDRGRISRTGGMTRLGKPKGAWYQWRRPAPTWVSMHWFYVVVLYIIIFEIWKYCFVLFACYQGPSWFVLWSGQSAALISPRALARAINVLTIAYLLVNVVGFLAANGAKNRLQRIPYVIALEYLLVLQYIIR